MIKETLIEMYLAEKARRDAEQAELQQQRRLEECQRLQIFLDKEKSPFALEELTHELARHDIQLRFDERARTPSLQLPPCPGCGFAKTVPIYSLADIGEYLLEPGAKLCYHCTQATKKVQSWQDKLIDAITEAVREALSSA